MRTRPRLRKPKPPPRAAGPPPTGGWAGEAAGPPRAGALQRERRGRIFPVMALPDGFLDRLRERLVLSDIVGRRVVWDRRRSTPAKGDFWAPCPFHQEKTASFHVQDQKGRYYCFGCHAKGDMITFVRETEGLSFMEAVDRLAAEAGLEMPGDSAGPEVAAARDRTARLAEVMEEAVRLYARAFRSAAGRGARDYAASRGLAAETLARFEIGYAPADRRHQTAAFREAGRLEDAVAAGLVICPEDGGSPYDRFRDRLMFPIRDARGTCIAFGGRALSPEARAKYLNSPETDLFHKGRVLYNERQAREAAAKSGRLILAEGYMDVIALDAAGFRDAAAPLGTAVTPDQLTRAWRIAPEPVVALDGDAAGLRAANALIDVALPALAPGRSLGFCLLPEGQDPDDLIRAGGARAMTTLLEDAVPLVEMLWRREVGTGPLDTPERRAALDQRLRAVLARIEDPSVRAHYEAELRTRRAALLRPARAAPVQARAPGRSGRFGPPPGPMPGTLASWLARDREASAAARGREATILLTALANPAAATTLEAEIEDMPLVSVDLEGLRDCLLTALAEGAPPEPAARAAGLGDLVDALAGLGQVRALGALGRVRDAGEARAMLAEMIARHASRLAAGEELAAAAEEIAGAEGEDWTHRVRAAGAMPREVDSAALKQTDATPQRRDGALARMAAAAEAGAYRRKKRPPPTSNH